MKCWIIYNGFLESNKFKDFAQMLANAATVFGHEAHIVKNDEVLQLLTTNASAFFNDKSNIPNYILFTDKDIYLAKQLELLGIPVFNSANTIEISDDKIKTYQYLTHSHLPIPKTIVNPKTYGMRAAFDDSYYTAIIDTFGFPFIIKEAFGSFGEQVYLVHDEAELRNYVDTLSDRPFMFQQFIETSYGKDLRLQVIGDNVICAMMRTADNDFRANVTAGGKMTAYEPNEKERTLAIQASKAIGAHFSGVDLLFGKNGEPIVCEVNSNAHIRNLLDCTGVNVAYYIIRYVENWLKVGSTS